MTILAQHGYADGGKIAAGIGSGLLGGAILSPRHLTDATLLNKVGEIRAAGKHPLVLLDPQLYAGLVAGEDGARLGKLISHHSAYFRPMQIKDIRREKQIRELLDRAWRFQRGIEGLGGAIMPNITIEDGLRSESANVAKLFLELSNEFAEAQSVQENTWLTLALGSSCFRNTKDLEDLANEITGLGISSKGFYLLCECSPSSGPNPWHEPHLLSGLMYLNYALTSCDYEVINGYSFVNAPFLAAAGGTRFASGWYNTSRYFSLDHYRAVVGMGRRPNRKYLCRALWKRLDAAMIRPFMESFRWLLNGDSTDLAFTEGEPSDGDECLQHWQAINGYTNTVVAIDSVAGRISLLESEMERAQRMRTELTALAIPNFDDQYRDLRMCLRRFAELAEL